MNLKYTLVLVLSIVLQGSQVFSQKIGYYTSGGTQNNSVESVKTICEVMGYPVESVGESLGTVDALHDLKAIVNYDVVFLIDCSSYSLDKQLYADEFKAFLNKGGLLFADYYSTYFSESIFGTQLSELKTDAHTRISLVPEVIGEGMHWLNDSLEQVIPMCRDGKLSFRVYDLSPTTATPIAYYEDDKVAVTCQYYDNGKAYFFGPSWKRLVTFPRNNKDIDAQRVSSNGFEPGADIVPLLIRGIIEGHFGVTVWKHTLPKDDQSVLMITHDVDATSGYDTAQHFINWEAEHRIPGHYFLTTKYFDDGVTGPFYTQSNDVTGKEILNKILDNGLTVGSHSVGHFRDMGDRDVFPLGVMDVNQATYAPYNDGEETVGGTLLGEFVVSKQILAADGDLEVKSFRSGHLVFNKRQAEGLEMAGYKMESSFSANDVMTGFPYFLQKDQSSVGALVDVLEIPLHISDVIDNLDKDNYLEAVDLWYSALQKYGENYAPVTLLVHPTRYYKIAAIDSLIRRTEGKTTLVNFEAMNDFWRERHDLKYSTTVDSGVLTISVPDSLLPISSTQSLHITKGKALDAVMVKSNSGRVIDFDLQDWGDDGLLLRFASVTKDFSLATELLSPTHLKATFAFDGEPQVDFDSVRWDFGDGQYVLHTYFNQVTHYYDVAGYYDVSLIVWHNGVKTAILKKRMVYLPEQSAGMTNGASDISAQFRLFPNPTTQYVSVQVDGVYQVANAVFYDLQGHKLSESTTIDQPIEVPIESGVCLLRLTVDGKVYVQKVVKM